MKKVLASVIAMMFSLVVAGAVFAAEPAAAPADNAVKVEKKAGKKKGGKKKAAKKAEGEVKKEEAKKEEVKK
jgi:uncharacterized protein YxeA